MEGTKERIFNNAVLLFGTHGYDAISIRKLTKAVGIKESSFYNHFISKSALLEEIFTIMNYEMSKTKVSTEQLEQLTDELDLSEYLKLGIDKFIQQWKKPLANKIWAVVSMEQYRNEKAAKLIITETEKAISMFMNAFKLLQLKGKMKKEDPYKLARIYGFSLRALHLDYSLKSFLSKNEESTFTELYDNAQFFAEKYKS